MISDMNRPIFFAFLTGLVFFAFPGVGSAAVDTVRTIAFPVGGSDYLFRNDFLEPRGGGTRQHQGTDILAEKMTPLVAAVDGYVSFVANPQATWGYEIELQDDDGYTYDYLHVNNDMPGTDDGMGGVTHAYVSGITRGVRVTKGQHIGWVGDSGNAEETVPHLHFEIHDAERKVVNPFFSLAAASGGRGISTNLPSTGTVEPTFEERKASLRYIFSKTMIEGSESSDVRQLQLTLKAMGYFTYPVATGYFGPVTRNALIAYQKKKGIPQTGEADLLTRRALNTELGTWDPNDYIPFYNEAEQRAIKIAQLQQMIVALQAQLRQMRGY
jgi:murein DD-endopeptidase MepM/ murein hydrolase activator NlpD